MLSLDSKILIVDMYTKAIKGCGARKGSDSPACWHLALSWAVYSKLRVIWPKLHQETQARIVSQNSPNTFRRQHNFDEHIWRSCRRGQKESTAWWSQLYQWWIRSFIKASNLAPTTILGSFLKKVAFLLLRTPAPLSPAYHGQEEAVSVFNTFWETWRCHQAFHHTDWHFNQTAEMSASLPNHCFSRQMWNSEAWLDIWFKTTYVVWFAVQEDLSMTYLFLSLSRAGSCAQVCQFDDQAEYMLWNFMLTKV